MLRAILRLTLLGLCDLNMSFEKVGEVNVSSEL
jgi:hypothetical protein